MADPCSKTTNNIDDHVDDDILKCLNPDALRSFFLFAGAGSGKTRTLVNVLTEFQSRYGNRFMQERRKIAVITYTNAAADEIKDRLQFDPIFLVSTIHSFAWELIKNFSSDIKEWLKEDLQVDIQDLENKQSKSKNLNNKTSIDRARKIESKSKRLSNLGAIKQFTYNPNGDNISKDSLNHSEVIKLTAYFIQNKPLMRDLIICKYPILLIDESQDTKKELIDAFFHLEAKNIGRISLGLFGDMMQRIYADGKKGLGESLPEHWLKPTKLMNHRSNKRIIRLINTIRKAVDDHYQCPRLEKNGGTVRLFISNRQVDKYDVELNACNRMAQDTQDDGWKDNTDNIKSLILEHHMAAYRMGFAKLFEPLYKESKLATGLLDGSLGGLNFFVRIILPLYNAHVQNDWFTITSLATSSSPLLTKEEIEKHKNQMDSLANAKTALMDLFSLWDSENDPSLLNILEIVSKHNLFVIPNTLSIIASRTDDDKKVIEKNPETDEEDYDSTIDAWEKALQAPFSQIIQYNTYLSDHSKFGTHQGVKGLQYQRVMAILDDGETRGFLYKYDKLFGAKELSKTDIKKQEEGNEIELDRARRLFYVICSRAIESLAIVLYTDDVNSVKTTMLENGWFTEDEILIV